MTTIPNYRLNDGNDLPAIGFGTYPLTGDDGSRAIGTAIDAGYRLLDTAVNYGNEDAVGRAIAASGVARDDFLITTKVPGRHHGRDVTASFNQSLAALGVETIDLYLIHWPNPSVDRYVETFESMIGLQDRGLVTHIGVSNFTIEFLLRLKNETGLFPAVNQIELHPYFPQTELLAFHAANGIRTESWSPLGKASDVKSAEAVTTAASAHGVTPAQAILRWQVQLGSIPLPKSADPVRQRENLDVFGFELTDAEMAAITALGRKDGRLFGGDPLTHEEQ
jgi:2,5-diketo-D-gluconate reductase A